MNTRSLGKGPPSRSADPRASRTRKVLALAALFGAVTACGDTGNHLPDASGDDLGVAVDLARDAGSPSDFDFTGILGTLGGPCGLVAGQLAATSPSLIKDSIWFMPPETYVRSALSPGGQKIFDTPNAGGSSTESEVMSFEILHFCEGAALVKTETEIQYAPPDDAGPNTITDILVSIDGKKVGVSVTRAYKPAFQGAITDDEVQAIIEGKLKGIVRSSMRVLPEDRWVKQILHVFVAAPAVADAVLRVWPRIDAAVRADTIVVVTTTKGGGFIYCNPDPPLGMECP